MVEDTDTDADASDLTDIDQLELSWNLRPATSPPPRPTVADNCLITSCPSRQTAGITSRARVPQKAKRSSRIAKRYIDTTLTPSTVGALSQEALRTWNNDFERNAHDKAHAGSASTSHVQMSEPSHEFVCHMSAELRSLQRDSFAVAPWVAVSPRNPRPAGLAVASISSRVSGRKSCEASAALRRPLGRPAIIPPLKASGRGTVAISTGAIAHESSPNLPSFLHAMLASEAAAVRAEASPTSLPLAGVDTCTPNALPARRAPKPVKRYVDEIDVQQNARKSQRPSENSSEPSSSRKRKRIPSIRETGFELLATTPIGTLESTAQSLPVPSSWEKVRPTAALIVPRDPELGRPPIRPQSDPSNNVLPSILPSGPPVSTSPATSRERDVSSSTRAGGCDKTAFPVASAKAAKAPKPRARHPALDSRESWVPVERDLRITAAGKPPIWCQGRQELCESLDYFKSYQGGHYDNQERCLGYLLDGFPSPSDACTAHGKVIISHGGGCSEVLAAGGSRLRANQTRNGTRVRALKNCMQTSTPVVLLVGAAYEHFPRLKDMGSEEGGAVRYAVLGHYFVTDIWAEGEPVEGAMDGKFFVRFKVRFEWLASQGEPWFTDIIGKEPYAHYLLGIDRAVSGLNTSGPRPCASCPAPTAATSDVSSTLDFAASGASSSVTPVDLAKESEPPLSSSSSSGLRSDQSQGRSDLRNLCEREASLLRSDLGFTAVPSSADQESELVKCEACESTHKRVYIEQIACYNEECDKFFRIDGVMPVPGSLTYRQAFLAVTTSLPSPDRVPQQLVPPTLQSLAGSSHITDHSLRAWRGFGCAVCGRLSSREDWCRLVCAGCGAETDATAHIRRATELASKAEGRAFELGPTFVRKSEHVTPITKVSGYEGYTVNLLPGEGCGIAKVHHLWPTQPDTSTYSDKLFEDYQDVEAGALFRRNKLTKHCATGNLLCQQFTFNTGERYSHAVSMATYPFPDPALTAPVTQDENPMGICAPACTREARDYLVATVRSVVGDQPQIDFNEILSVAYMAGGKMNYHDDGERGLGPYVASISLGADAIMSFRTKAKAKSHSSSKTGHDNVDTPADDQIVVDAGMQPKSSSKSRVVLKVRLKHGHVLIMEGRDMQKLFEHKVVPEGLRFAATARWVGPDHLAPRTKPSARPPAAPSVAPTNLPATHNAQYPTQISPTVSLGPPAETATQSGPTRAPWPMPVVAVSASTAPAPRMYTGPPMPRLAAMPIFESNRAIAAALGVPPHDRRVRDTPRSHPRGDALPAPQLLHSYGATPERGLPIYPPIASPDAAQPEVWWGAGTGQYPAAIRDYSTGARPLMSAKPLFRDAPIWPWFFERGR